MSSSENPLVSIIMGSKSDLPVMQEAEEMLKKFSIPYEIQVVSAHRTPQNMISFAEQCGTRGVKVIIAAAGGAAHLPGMVASVTTCPVIGVPIHSRNSIQGWDSILSILQMPKGVPVATVALDGAANAGILAAQIIACGSDTVKAELEKYKEELRQHVANQNADLKN